jgi:hypothetical protein
MSTPKAKSLSAFIPVATVLVLPRMAAIPWLSAMPAAYAGGSECDPKKDPKCDRDNKKVTVYRVPPGNPVNVHKISVPKHAAEKHIKQHGDFTPTRTGIARRNPTDSF